jgi:hypothetical protein
LEYNNIVEGVISGQLFYQVHAFATDQIQDQSWLIELAPRITGQTYDGDCRVHAGTMMIILFILMWIRKFALVVYTQKTLD